MIRIDYPVIVEGKYDKITLQNIIDATIITTDGFGIFKNKEKRELIKKLAAKKGIVIITDSDYAGMQIRAHLKNICAGENIINVYIPQIKGKEKRKSVAGKQGLLGVEGLDEKTICDALEKSGVLAKQTSKKERITKQHLYLLGLTGRDNSAKARVEAAEALGLPGHVSSSAFLDAANSLYSLEEFISEVEKWKQGADKK